MRWVQAVVVALGVLAGCGGDDDSVSEREYGRYELGNGVSVQIHELIDPVTPDRQYEDTYGIDADPKPGMRFVAFDVEYFNDSDRPVDRTLEYGAVLHSTDGQQESPMIDPPTNDFPEVAKTIPSKRSVRGWVMYEVAEGAEPDVLLLYSEVGEDPVEVEVGAILGT